MKEIDLITKLHKSTKRNYIERMINNKVHCMDVASQFESDYWDGDRKYGYGGYSYDGRWKGVAKELIKRYSLTSSSKVIDFGCGKAHIIFELKKLLPGITVKGVDISIHALNTAPDEIKPSLTRLDLRETPFPFQEKEFDLALSINTLHNLGISKLVPALREVIRVSKKQYICNESYRNNQELFNLQCWALTCNSFYTPADWEWIYKEADFTGNYEFIYFE